ncbi:MAG: PHP domain-containing protein, partial [Armatimonadota bacterium]
FLTPEQAVLWHLQRGYKVVAVTDSNTVKGGKIAQRFVERTKLPVTVLVGEEFRGKTHLILLNIRSDISPKDFDVHDAIKETKRQGGIAVAAHPWTSKHSIEELVEWGIDGFEIVNGSALGDEKLRNLCKERKLAALGNLDLRSDSIPETATVLPKWANTPQKVAQALKEGKCAVIYLRDRISTGEFNLLKSWLDEFKDLWRTGATANFVGIAFWVAVGHWAIRRKKNKPLNQSTSPSLGRFAFTSLLILTLFILSASFLVWAMARDLKQNWFPPLPLAVAIWAITCFVNWLLWWVLVSPNLSRRRS